MSSSESKSTFSRGGKGSNTSPMSSGSSLRQGRGNLPSADPDSALGAVGTLRCSEAADSASPSTNSTPYSHSILPRLPSSTHLSNSTSRLTTFSPLQGMMGLSGMETPGTRPCTTETKKSTQTLSSECTQIPSTHGSDPKTHFSSLASSASEAAAAGTALCVIRAGGSDLTTIIPWAPIILSKCTFHGSCWYLGRATRSRVIVSPAQSGQAHRRKASHQHRRSMETQQGPHSR